MGCLAEAETPTVAGILFFGRDPQVLDHCDHYGAEIDRTGYLVSALSLKYGVSVSRVFVTESDWSRRETPFLANVREEAIPA